MAEQKKKTAPVKNKDTSKNKTKTASSKNKKTANKANTRYEGVRKEVVMLIMLGIAILLFAFLISGSTQESGIAGQAAVFVLYGIFGVGAWILPLALIVCAIYLASEKDMGIFKIRMALSSVLFLDILAFIQSLSGAEKYSDMGISAIISLAFRSGSSTNGGLIGTLIYYGFYKMVGNIGCYIIFTLLAIILTMLISGGSFINFVRKTAASAKDIKDRYFRYYYEDEDCYQEYYIEEDIEEPVDIQPPKRRKRNPVVKDVEVTSHKTKPLTMDIKKVEKRDHKISLITEELMESKNAEVTNDDDLSGIINIFERYNDKHNTQGKNNNTQNNDDLSAENTEGTLPVYEINQTSDENIINSNEDVLIDVDTQQNIEIDKEDVPPWEDCGSPEDEPEIIKAGEIKLVDKLNVDKRKTEYKFPKLEFLGKPKGKSPEKTKEEIYKKSRKLEETLAVFKVEAKVNNISIGPTVTRYELTPSTGTKVSAVTNLENDIKFSMAAESIIIEAPIPGKSAIGIEIPNDTRESVYFSEVLRSEQFQKFKSKISFGLGKDITGSVVVADLAKMPHLLVAGTTGSGKSVCINTLIMSILYKATPDEVKMIMVDPKMVELSVYNGIPHLLLPVVTEPEKAVSALNWAVIEMERRYKLLATTGTRNLEGYNQKVSREERLSQIVIIIDELADLMMVVGKEVETSICRLAQKARAAGMHLVLATQRPSADVLTGLIRSNVPSRIAFKVSGSMDSRIILDSTGAEKLLGKGDMLFKTADMAKAMRIQGAFITDEEVEKVVSYIGTDNPNYDESIINEITKASITITDGADGGDDDPMTEEVLEWIVANPKCASAGKVQRHFRIGFNRASRIIETLEERGILGPVNGSQPREVLMDKYELRERKERYDFFD